MTTLKKLRFKAALWLWARALPVLAWKRSLPSLLALTKPRAAAPYQGLPAHYIVRRVKKSTRRPWVMRDRPCLREGILALRFLRLAGFDPALHFGVDRQSVRQDVLSAHCWIVLDQVIILNPPTPTMVEILIHAGGRLVPPAHANVTLSQG